MSSPALEIAEYLAEQDVAGQFGGAGDWSVHVSREPREPANVVTVYDTGGIDPDAGDLRQPQIQVRVRAVDYRAGMERLEAIRALLVQPNAELGTEQLERTIGASRYVTVAQLGDILPIGRDDKDRHLLTCNFQLIRQVLEES